MTIAATSLGVNRDASSPFTLATSGSVPAGALAVVKIGWVRSVEALITPTCSGGSLTWTLDAITQSTITGFNYGVAIFSAPAPAGLASATTLTVASGADTFDFGIYIGAEYYTGVELGDNRVDITKGNIVFAGDTAWTTGSMTTVTPNVALSAVAWQDNALASTPGEGAELFDSHDATVEWDFVSQWREVSSAGSYSATGTWTGGTPDAYAAAVVAYKATIQTLTPSADSVDGSWTDQAAGTSLAAAIDEVAASDTDYIQSEVDPTTSGCRVKLSSGIDPSSSSGHIIRWRIRKDSSGGDTTNMTVTLRQGGGDSLGAGTQIATFTRNDVDGSGWTTYSETLSGAEADSITDYSDLYLEFYADTP